MACGNSVELNISSSVTVFAGHQQVQLLSSIIQSTTSSTISASGTTDVAVVSPLATMPYQAIISGNKITVIVLSSSEKAQELSSSVTASSSSKLQPLLQLSIDHPLYTMKANSDCTQYNISCYDAHVDLAVGDKNYSSESSAVSTLQCW